MNGIINDISNFIFLKDEPRKCDVIIAVVGSYPQIAERSAELYKDGFAPYVMATGGVSVKTGRFNGVKERIEIYNGDYATECDFYSDVLIKNGVPESAILREDKSGHTRGNAVMARSVADENRFNVHSAIIVCKNFHARRCQMFFQSAFQEAELIIVPVDIVTDGVDVGKDKWFLSEYGTKRVLGELARCGNQMNEEDIVIFRR